jgi:hypothetical protein
MTNHRFVVDSNPRTRKLSLEDPLNGHFPQLEVHPSYLSTTNKCLHISSATLPYEMESRGLRLQAYRKMIRLAAAGEVGKRPATFDRRALTNRQLIFRDFEDRAYHRECIHPLVSIHIVAQLIQHAQRLAKASNVSLVRDSELAIWTN